jgi:hypothetical protein
MLSDPTKSKNAERAELDEWRLLWILEVGDSVSACVKVDSELPKVLATTSNLYVDSICGLILDSLEYWETKELSVVRSYRVPKFERALDPKPTSRPKNCNKIGDGLS